MIRRAMKIVIGTAVVSVFMIGASSLFTPAQARGTCYCPDVFDPVICSNGVTYSNGCVASCNHATGCHRTGDI